MLQRNGHLAVRIRLHRGVFPVFLHNKLTICSCGKLAFRGRFVLLLQCDDKREVLVRIAVYNGLGHLKRTLHVQGVGNGRLAVLLLAAALVELHGQLAHIIGVLKALRIQQRQFLKGILPLILCVEFCGLAFHRFAVLVQLHGDTFRTYAHLVVFIQPHLFHAEAGLVIVGILELDAALGKSLRCDRHRAVRIVRHDEGEFIHRSVIGEARFPVIHLADAVHILPSGLIGKGQLAEGDLAVRIVGDGLHHGFSAVRMRHGQFEGELFRGQVGAFQGLEALDGILPFGGIGIDERSPGSFIGHDDAAIASHFGGEACFLRLGDAVLRACGQLGDGRRFAALQGDLALTVGIKDVIVEGSRDRLTILIRQRHGKGKYLLRMIRVGAVHRLADLQRTGFDMIGDHSAVVRVGHGTGQFAVTGYVLHCDLHFEFLRAVFNRLVFALNLTDGIGMLTLLRVLDGVKAHRAIGFVGAGSDDFIVFAQLEGKFTLRQLAAHQVLPDLHKSIASEGIGIGIGDGTCCSFTRSNDASGFTTLGPAGQIAGFLDLISQTRGNARQGNALAALEGHSGLAVRHRERIVAHGKRTVPGLELSIRKGHFEGEFLRLGAFGQIASKHLAQLQAAGLGGVVEHQLVRRHGFAAFIIGNGGTELSCAIVTHSHRYGVFRFIVIDGTVRTCSFRHGIRVDARRIIGDGIKHHTAAGCILLGLHSFGRIFIGRRQHKGEGIRRINRLAIQQLGGTQGHSHLFRLILVGEGGRGGHSRLDHARIVGLADQHPALGQLFPDLVGRACGEVAEGHGSAGLQREGVGIIRNSNVGRLLLPLGGEGDRRICSVGIGRDGAGAIRIQGVLLAIAILEARQVIHGAGELGRKGVGLANKGISRRHGAVALIALREVQRIERLCPDPGTGMVALGEELHSSQGLL